MQQIPQSQSMNENLDHQATQPVEVQVDGSEILSQVVQPVNKNNKLVLGGFVTLVVFLSIPIVFGYQKYMSQGKVGLGVDSNTKINNLDQVTESQDAEGQSKSYLNKEYQFKINYPLQLSNGQKVIVIENSQSINFTAQPDWGFNINISSDDTIENIVKEVEDFAINNDWIVSDSENFIFNGIEAMKVDIKTDIGDYTHIFFKKNGKIFEIEGLNHIESFSSIISTFEFVESKKASPITYSISLPDGYNLLKETTDVKEYGFNNFSYLTISTGKTTDLNSLGKDPDNCPSAEFDFCLSKGESWGQKEDVKDITLGGVAAKSFYIYGGIDNSYHVVQTTQNPLVELRMYVAGGGQDQQFSKVVSTFKFL